MAQKITLEIVTPQLSVLTSEVDEVVIPGVLGQFGVLPGHTTLLAEIGSGPLTYSEGGQSHAISVSGGFAEVRSDHVKVLADSYGDL